MQQNPPPQKSFLITQGQLAALMEFVGNLQLPWTRTNPVMNMLGSLPEIASVQGPFPQGHPFASGGQAQPVQSQSGPQGPQALPQMTPATAAGNNGTPQT